MRHGITLIELMLALLLVAMLSITIFISFDKTTEEAEEAWVINRQKKLQVELNMIYAKVYQDEVQAPGAPLPEWRYAELPAEKGPWLRASQPTATMERVKQGPRVDGVPLLLSEGFQVALYQAIQLGLDVSKYIQYGFAAILNDAGLKAVCFGKDSSLTAPYAAQGDLAVFVDVYKLLATSRAASPGDTITDPKLLDALFGPAATTSWNFSPPSAVSGEIPLGPIPQNPDHSPDLSFAPWAANLFPLEVDTGGNAQYAGFDP